MRYARQPFNSARLAKIYSVMFTYLDEKIFVEHLEKVLDAKGLNYILLKLSEISQEKASHVAENWQDEPLSKAWDKTASKIDRFRLGSIRDICPLF